MGKITVTQEEVDKRFDEGVQYVTLIGNCVIVDWAYYGWHIVESSACVYAEKYDEEIGMNICIEKIKDRIWKMLGYELFLEKIEGEK